MQIPRDVSTALLAVLLLIMGLALYGVQQPTRQPGPETPAATETDVPKASETPTPAPLPTVEIPINATRFSGRSGYSITIPPGWVVVDYTGDTMPALAMTMGADALQPTYSQFVQANGAQTVELVAYDALAAKVGHIPTTLSIVAVPRNRLGLQGYLAASAEELAQFAPVETRVDHALRADGLPTGLLSFQTPGEIYGQPGQEIINTQAVLMDAHGEQFILLTFATDAASSSEQRPLWEEMIHSVEFR